MRHVFFCVCVYENTKISLCVWEVVMDVMPLHNATKYVNQ